MSDDIRADLQAMAGADVEVVYCDPPWAFKSNSAANPGRNAMRHYPTMSLAAIQALPVKPIVAKNAHCFMWIPPSFIAIGAHIPIMKAWGFAPSSIGFTWIKVKASIPWHWSILESDLHLGTGLTTRKNAEVCVLGSRGLSLRQGGDVREVIFAPVREHSRKPDEAARRIVQYVGPGRRMVELFSRSTSPGFQPLGNDVGKFDGVA